MTARWLPSDDELDKIARSIDRGEPAADRAEQGRTSLLAIAAVQRQQSRHSLAPWLIVGGALAAAAALVIWIVAKPAEPAQVAAAFKQRVTPIGIARFDRVTDWPDYVVRVDHGHVAVQVAKLDRGERFRIKTADAEVEVRGTKFDVGVDTGRLTSVVVYEGRVEIRRADAQVILLSTGESWAPVQTAEAIELRAPVQTPENNLPTPVQTAENMLPTPVQTAENMLPAPVPPEQPTNQLRVPDHRPPRSTHHKVEPVVVNPPPLAEPTTPGEAEFRAAWAALRAGNASAAAKTFAKACNTARNDAIAEDACFWAGAAAKKAGDLAAAKPALKAFIDRFASSARAPEAAALLGWILYDAGDLDGAEQQFTRAAHDRVPRVRDSAERGLEAVKRKR